MLEEKDIDSLVEIGLRAIDTKYFKENIRIIRAYTQRLTKGEFSDIFLGVRNNRLTFYYYGREVITLDFSNNDEKNFDIITREEFKGEKGILLNEKLKEIVKNIPLKKEYDRVKKEYKVSNVEDFSNSKKSHKYYINTSKLKGYSNMIVCEYLLREIKEILKERYNNKISTELQVQGQYTITYNFKKNKDLYIVDMEFILSNDVKRKLGVNIEGRYDMIGLSRTSKEKYKLIFIELKSKKGAIKDKKTGINDHIKDMDTFLSVYNNKELELKNLITSNIKTIVELKGEKNLKLFKGLDINMIDFDNPQFWLLFDMVDKTEIKNINDIKNIINENIEVMDKSNAELKLYKGTLGKNIKNGKIILME